MGLLPSNLDLPARRPVTDVHVPRRPQWYCRHCWRDWPCPDAAKALREQLAEQPTATRIYLAGQFQHAMDDLTTEDDWVYGKGLWRRIVELRE